MSGGASHPDSVLANVARAAFVESGMSIKALSDRSGVAYSSCHSFVRGVADPTVSTLSRLCDVLGLELVKRKRG